MRDAIPNGPQVRLKDGGKLLASCRGSADALEVHAAPREPYARREDGAHPRRECFLVCGNRFQLMGGFRTPDPRCPRTTREDAIKNFVETQEFGIKKNVGGTVDENPNMTSGGPRAFLEPTEAAAHGLP